MYNQKQNIQPSVMSPFGDPWSNSLNLQLELFIDIYSGTLGNAIKRKMRQQVEASLREKFGEDFASSSYDHICQLIINVFLFSTNPEFKTLPIDNDTVLKLKQTYPLQIKYLSDISARIREGFDADRLKNYIESDLRI